MDKLRNSLLARVSTPFPQLYKRNLTLLLNANGDILDLETPEEEGFVYSIVCQLRTVGNIRPLFGFKKSLNEIIKEDGEFPGYADQFKFVEEEESFYTTFPVLSLRLVRLSRSRFLGTLYPFRTLPTSFEFSSEGIVYIDPAESLVGFNRAFFDIFRSAFSDPRRMLGQPLSRFVSPTPEKVQSDYFERQPALEEASFTPAFRMDFAAGKRGGGKTFSMTGKTSRRSEGLRWEATGPDGASLTLREALAFDGTDILVRLGVEAPTGALPCIIFGDKNREEKNLDTQGYLLGQDASKERILLKRAGLTISGRPFKFPRTLDAETAFFKAGHAFGISRSGQSIFRYFDFEYIEKKKAFLSLYLRQGCRCLLKSIEVSFRPTPRPAGKMNYVVQAKIGDGGFYLWNRLNSFTLSSHGGEMTGYKMQDVSGYEARLKEMKTRYDHQVREGRRLKTLLRTLSPQADPWIGASPAMLAVKEKALRTAPASVTLLIQGATGTGKEVLAKFIHANSPLSEGPFVKVDCSTIPKTLMESELFGHEKGAFTGAVERKSGLFEMAEGGTLFLDEVNNLSLESQSKLLHFLQDFKITRVGGATSLQLHLRIVAATNVDLHSLVSRGIFREDLFYRLAVVTLDLPPLKERMADLPDLCRHFLSHFNALHGKNVQGISPEGYQALYRHGWPGNVRELKNVMEQAVLFCDGGEVDTGHLTLGSAGAGGAAPGVARERRLMGLSKEELEEVLGNFRGVIKSVAAHFGVTPRALYYRFSLVGINPNAHRPRPRKPARKGI